MTLESLLKSLKSIDEFIHKPYEKWGLKLDKRSPKSRNYTALGLGLAGIPFFIFSPYSSSFWGLKGVIAGGNIVLDLYACSFGSKNQENTSGVKVSDFPVSDFPLTNLYIELMKMVRSPFFVGGVGFVGKGVYGLVSEIINNEPISSASYWELSHGLSMISLSSSMFLKDKQPKLLEKEPFLKQAYNWVKEKSNSLMPQPKPQPIPVQRYSILENYF